MKKCGFFTDTCELDERQLLLRGNVFKHTTILLFGLILFNAMLKDYGITWAEGRNENFLIFWAGAALAMCEFTLRGINPSGRRNGILYIFLGLCGGGLAGLSLSHILAEGKPFIADGMLTTYGGAVLQGTAMLLVFLTYWCKWLYDRRRASGDEE